MTLVDEVKSITNLADKAGVNKKEAMRNIIETYRDQHALLESVIKGETTFQETYAPLLQNEGRVRERLTEAERNMLTENQDLINLDGCYYSSPDVASAPFRNAFAGGLVFGLIGPALVGLRYLFGIPTGVEDLLIGTFVAGTFGAGFSSYLGNVAKSQEDSCINEQRMNAMEDLELLDRQILGVYKGEASRA